MKKLLTLLLLSSLIMPLRIMAISPTTTVVPSPSLSPSTSVIDNQINSLRAKIASRVAELKLVDKRGIIGTVSDVNTSQITLNDLQNNQRFVDIDELTNFSSPDIKSFGISDITKGMTIGVLGLYNKESRKLLARFVDVLDFQKTFDGKIISIDKDNFLLHIATIDNNDIPVDIETFTKTYAFTKADGLKKSGFSKMTVGDRIFLVGSPDTHNKSHILASRITLFPEIPANPLIMGSSPSGSDDITPSTGSGKKLVPIIQK